MQSKQLVDPANKCVGVDRAFTLWMQQINESQLKYANFLRNFANIVHLAVITASPITVRTV